MTNTYRNESSNPKWNAQRNLQGRTHYVDDDTMKFHKSRILSTHIPDNGLLFALVESCAADSEGKSRIYRPVIFNIFGTVLSRPKIDDGYKTSKAATNAMWEALENIDPIAVTREGIEHAEVCHKREMDHVRNLIQSA